jgi:protein phosphatase
VSLRYAVRTDTGREREQNEDYAQVFPELGLFVIADGMGGHIAGEVASHVAVETVAAVISRHEQPKLVRDEGPLLGEAILAAHMAVAHKAEELELHGMGTTLTALRIRGRTATIAHVGDSRVCFLRDGKLKPLTRDHTLVTMLVESGVINSEEAMHHPERHLLTQAVGPAMPIEPDVFQLRLPRQVRILLSTDGLHDIVPPAELIELASEADLERAAEKLIERANERGGPDNITVILIDT